jgi:SPP1 family phage portal protein
MSTYYKYAEMIDKEGGIITPAIIELAIKDHQATFGTTTREKFGRYRQDKENTPILTRPFEGEAAKKINNKLANDYFGEIVDTKVGYMFGQPITIGYDKAAVGYDGVVKQIDRFKKVNNLDDLNAEMGKHSAICGYDVGICYFDKEGQERVMRIDPWEAIVISKTAFTEPEYGIIYYKKFDETCRVEAYNGTTRTIYEGTEFAAESLELVESETKAHGYKYCPMYGTPNNAELQGDGDKVFSLIDGQDRAISDMNNEIEQFAEAFILFIGYEPTKELIAEMVKTGALYIPDAADGERIEWLTKNLDPAYTDSFLNRNEANITRFAKHVNFTDAAFGGQITGPAMRFKLFALETKAKYFERKHEAAMMYMFKVVGSAWNTKSIPFDYTLLNCTYTRNIPVNLLDEANTAVAMSAITSKRTALASMSSVPDVDEELDLIAADQAEMIDLDDPELTKDKKIDEKGKPIEVI